MVRSVRRKMAATFLVESSPGCRGRPFVTTASKAKRITHDEQPGRRVPPPIPPARRLDQGWQQFGATLRPPPRWLRSSCSAHRLADWNAAKPSGSGWRRTGPRDNFQKIVRRESWHLGPRGYFPAFRKRNEIPVIAFRSGRGCRLDGATAQSGSLPTLWLMWPVGPSRPV